MSNARASRRLALLAALMGPSLLSLPACSDDPPLGGGGGGEAEGGNGGAPDLGGQAGDPQPGSGGVGEGGQATPPGAGDGSGGASPPSCGGGAGTTGTSGEGGISIGVGGEGGESGAPEAVLDALPQANVRWLGPCTPVALSDDAQTALALEGVWTVASGWIPLPDLPGGETSNIPRTLSGNGQVVYGSAGSELGDEIYRFDVPSQTIQGLGERYYSYEGQHLGTWLPHTLRTIDTNEDGSMLVGFGYNADPELFRWTASTGFTDILGGAITDTGFGPSAAVLSANGETAIFSSSYWPQIVGSLPVSIVSDQFVGTYLYPTAVSGDGRRYAIAGTNFMPDDADHCVFGDDCSTTSFAILDLDYDGNAGVGMQGWGGGREPVGTFYWSSAGGVRYLHEALHDSNALVDVEILARAAISADGRGFFGTAARHFTDGSSRRECFIAELEEPGESTVAKIAEPGAGSRLWAGRRSTCARGSDGATRCWGAGIAEMLERPVSEGWSALSLPPLADALQIAPGDGHSCAVFTDHSVRCWGSNSVGQLGDGTTLSSVTPVEALGVADAVQVAVAGDVTCALRDSGSITCWGSSNTGVMGVPESMPPARSVALSRWAGCALLLDGTVSCWGELATSDLPEPLAGLESVAQFVMANDLSWCALREDGSVTCSYANCAECAGRGYPSCDPWPAGPRALSFSGPVKEISVGDHVCGLLASGTVECAGLGASGQLGDRRGLCRDDLAAVQGVANAVHIASGSNHTCVLLADGAAQCWGLDDGGQLGNGYVFASRLDDALPPGISRPGYVRLGAE